MSSFGKSLAGCPVLLAFCLLPACAMDGARLEEPNQKATAGQRPSSLPQTFGPADLEAAATGANCLAHPAQTPYQPVRPAHELEGPLELPTTPRNAGTTLVPPGSTCRCDGDCQGLDDHNGLCVNGICMLKPSAPCSQAGSTTECPSGSRCWQINGSSESICWPDCAAFDCAGTCDEDNSCVATSALARGCDPSCARWCPQGAPQGDSPAPAPIGQACQADDECESGRCYQDPEQGWLDGYCLEFGCTEPGAPCGNGGRCVPDLGGPRTHVCLQSCEAGCRPGYACMSANETSFCFPHCGTAADCPSGLACVDRACVPQRDCSPDEPLGICPSGEACVAGSCEPLCSNDTPHGYCPEGFTCENGHCVSPSGCGTWECSSPDCDELVPLPGPSDPRSREAEALGYYVETSHSYSFLRRDIVQLIQWATCEMRARFPGVAPLALLDMTQANGETPGTDVGSPRHPTSTHRGNDIDTAYYQTDGSNDGHIICGQGTDQNPNGVAGRSNDGYFCTTEENIVDINQQAAFLSLIWTARQRTRSSRPLLRVVGIDQTLADDLQPLVPPGLSLGFGSTGGWQFHHHHHLHWSFVQ